MEVRRGLVEGRDIGNTHYILAVDTTADRSGARLIFRPQYREGARVQPDIDLREARIYFSKSVLVAVLDNAVHAWSMAAPSGLTQQVAEHVTPSYGLAVMRPNDNDPGLSAGMSPLDRYMMPCQLSVEVRDSVAVHLKSMGFLPPYCTEEDGPQGGYRCEAGGDNATSCSISGSFSTCSTSCNNAGDSSGACCNDLYGCTCCDTIENR
jgi:hypothetical protein